MPRLLVLWLFSLLPLNAQSVVEGVVVESVAKSPVVGATVQVIWTKPLQGDALIHGVNDIGPKATTDEMGRFRVEVPSPSEFTFKVTNESFSPLEGKAAGAFVLKERESKRDITLVLQQESSIEGSVHDPDLEKPVAGLRVEAIGTFSPTPGRSVFFGVAKAATTDAEGRFKLEGLRPGKYLVAAGPSAAPVLHPVRKPEPRPDHYARTLFPGTLEEASATVVDLLPGARAGAIDFRVRRSETYRVRGRIERADGQPVTGRIGCGSSTRIGPGGMGHRQLGRLENASAFEIVPVEPGTFAMYCTNDSETRKARLLGIAAVTVEDKDVDNIIVTLKAGVPVTGIVRTEDVAPGQLDPLWGVAEKAISVGLVRASGSMYSDEWPVSVDRDSGQWGVEGVHDELYNVRVAGLPAGYDVTAMEYNGLAMTFGQFQPNLGAMAHSMKISVAPVSNSVRGSVTSDDKPVENAIVMMVREPVPEDRFIWQSKAKLAGKNGEYAFETLEPGWYRIAATAPQEDREAIFNRLASGDCKRVEITKTANLTMDLKLD